MKRVGAAFVALLVLTTGTMAAEPGKFSGYVFGDYYYVANNHQSELAGRNGFWIRRVYFTYDRTLAEDFAMRLRFEMSHPGDFSAGKAMPFIKDAYLKWNLGQHQLYIGISPTPTWEVIEKIWGYRSVEKTPLDLQKMGSSRDFGVALRGSLDGQGKVVYHAMLGNGTGVQSDNDSGKNLLLSLGFHPSPTVTVEVYGDWNNRPEDVGDRYTLQGFFAYHTKAFRLGVQYAQQKVKAPQNELTLRVFSAFAAGKLGDRLNGFVRMDRILDPNPAGSKISYIPFDPTAKSTFLVLGLDFTPTELVHLMPNVEFVSYSAPEGGEAPSNDVIPRLTFYYKF